MAVDGRAPVISCPWHGWEYDLETGESFVSGDPGTKCYPVSLERGRSLGQAVPAERERSGGVPGPYVAETYPVMVDSHEYVVLDM
jgi:nitrite reductase/ring-hydroxylating ferredoxin subunit